MNFKCPYCSHDTTITNPNHFATWSKIDINESTKGDCGAGIIAITCPNEDCKELYLKTIFTNAYNDYGDWEYNNVIQEWVLLPDSISRVLPEYIPEAIKEDYYEACKIKNLSPKASATLSRRCLQGMIRDFWSIKKNRLKDEIDELKDKIDPLVWKGIDSVRSVGNIGAHMEKDINVIIDVDQGEADILIELIERLFDDWYISRHNKEKHLEQLKGIAKEKNDKKKNANNDEVEETD